MTVSEQVRADLSIEAMARQARAAALASARLDAGQRRSALEAMADAIDAHRSHILAANAVDLSAADENGVTGAMRDRLLLDDAGVAKLAAAIREVAAQEDPLGAVEDETMRPNGLRIGRMRIPLGVVAMIYESRPNVTSDAAALCLKAGNAVILRGGSEAIHSNRAIAEALREGLRASDVPVDAVQLVQTSDRSAIDVLLRQEESIDLVIPRGGEGLIRAVTEKSRIPVLQHYKGVCHVFIDASAPAGRATEIVVNAKVQRPGVCNALETLLVHEAAAEELLPVIAQALVDQGVELRGCPRTVALLESLEVVPATEDDWHEEYLDLILAVRIVDDLEAALDHIARYGSSHTDAIVTEDSGNAERFVSAVQSSTVLVNASTRFADGGELGLGAEIGISTSKLHAFGPMGARELTTRKFVVFGDGQVRG
ncbi:MAG: glutamate-5-semialdehyde dehydrogenase [Gemmatimonadota bacterium]|nr:glutamate-5-semialdehyde dehydrogenase [Gemmatimonadota bacterium]MDH3422856.1 glutamate-5-semialdehyde dehydrogenase [Gemmatimonadota bacterium]